jgi:hypothetical protein
LTVGQLIDELQIALVLESHPLKTMASSLVIDTSSLTNRQELLTDWTASSYGSAKSSMKRHHEG